MLPWCFPAHVRTRFLMPWGVMPWGTTGSDMQNFYKEYAEFAKEFFEGYVIYDAWRKESRLLKGVCARALPKTYILVVSISHRATRVRVRLGLGYPNPKPCPLPAALPSPRPLLAALPSSPQLCPPLCSPCSRLSATFQASTSMASMTTRPWSRSSCART